MSDKKYWLHRISHEWDVSYKLLSQGYLSIGWVNLANSGIVEAVQNGASTEEFEKIMSTRYDLGRSRWSLWRFCSFKRDDYVVVPLFSGEFSICQITGDPRPISALSNAEIVLDTGKRIVRDSSGIFKRAETGEIVDLGFIIPVTVLKDHLSRYDYADSDLTSRMKIRQTNADISDLAPSINKALDADTPINLYNTVIEELADKFIAAIKIQLNPDKFERLIKWYFQKIGASNVYIPAKNASDKWDSADADVVAEFDALKVIFYIQAKFHDDTSSSWAVEQIAKYKNQHETMSDETMIPWAISTASFSDDAIRLARENNVRLITGKEFAKMLIDAGITDINKAFE